MYYSNYNGQGGYEYNYGFEQYDRKETKRRFSRLFLSTAIYLIISTAIVYAVEIGTMILFGKEKALELFSNSYFIFALQILAMYIIAFPIFWLITHKLCKKDGGEELYIKRKMNPGEFTALFFICCAIMTFGAVASNTFTEFLSRILGHEIENNTSELISSSPLWLIILVAVIIGPIIEELIFRRIFIDALGRYGNVVAIVVSAVSFGIFHGNFSQLLYATGLGIILGYIYLRTNNILYSILMHMLINFYGTVPALLLSDSLDRVLEISMGATNNIDFSLIIGDMMNVLGLFVLQYGFAFAGVGIFVYSTAKKLYSVKNTPRIRIPGDDILDVTIGNAGAIIFLIICAGQFLISII